VTGLLVAGILVGAGLSVTGLVMAWVGAREDQARAERDLATARTLRAQQRAEMAALPDDRDVNDARAVLAASEARYEAAGLDRPSYDNVAILPLLARRRDAKRSGRSVRWGVGVSAVGVVVATVTSLLGL